MDAAEQVAESSSLATPRAARAVDALLERRADGEPLQYVLGSWSFCGIDVLVDRRVLIPRPETETVAQLAIEEVRRIGEQVGPPNPWTASLSHYAVADLGTGSGVLALALAAQLPDAEVWATDVSPDALVVARANVAGSGTLGVRIRIAEGSWFEALPPDLRGSLLVVVANPPYIAADEPLPESVARWEPTEALVSGPTGFEALESIVETAPAWLDPSGSLVLELAPHQAARAADLARGAGFAEVLVERDLAGRERVLVARRSRRAGRDGG